MSPLSRLFSLSDATAQPARSSIMFQTVSSLVRLLGVMALILVGGVAVADNTAEPNGKGHKNPHPAAAAGPVTGLSGQVMSVDGQPLANVALRDGRGGTRTNADGSFVLTGLPAGVSVLTIDGRHAGANGKTDYGLFEVQVSAVAGRTTALPFISYLPKIDHDHDVSIASPTKSEVVIKAATIPGLEIHIPAGAIITDTDGKPVRKIGITEIPLDRTPFPLPRNVEVPVFFTAQPGGGTITGVDGAWVGAQVYYPNYQHQLPKARGVFYKYDPFQNGWTSYGMGRVSADASQVIPDKDTRIYDLTGAMFNFGKAPPPPCGCGAGGPSATAADPVDLTSGHWVETHTDLSLADVVPLTLTRTYVSGDFNSRDFGVGMSLSYNIFVFSALQYQQADVILPSGTPIHYTRIQNNSNGFIDAVFVNTASGPSQFYQSRMVWNSDGWNLTLQDGTVYVFGNTAPLAAIQDRYGNSTTISRPSESQTAPISQITSPNGRFINFARDGSGRIIQAQDNAGRTVSYSYDGSGRMQTVTDADGGVTTYGWDAGNHITTITDPRGVVTVTNLYDGDDRVVTQTAADGGTSSFTYTGGGNDGFASETDITDPVGSVRQVSFNAAGFAVSDKQAVGTAQEQDLSYSYDPVSNLLLSTVDALGRVTVFAYDSNGNRTSVTRLAGTAEQVTTQYSYGVFNQLTAVTDPLGNVSLIGLNALGLPISQTDPLGNVTTLQYDTPPNLSQVTDPHGNQTSFTYDLGLPAAVTDPLGRTSTQYADPLGRTVRSTDPLGNVTAIAYDPLHGATQITQPNGEVTSINFQPAGLVGSIVDARTGTTSYAYDAKRRLVTRTDPLGHAERVTGYDGNDHVLSRVDRKGQMASFTYDALGRITTATYADGAVVGYSWDKGNRLTQIQDSVAGTITRSYDGLDRLVSETTPQGTVTYSYDAAGRRTGMSVPGQAQVTYAYDAAGQLTQIAQGSAIVTIGYDAAGRRTSLTLPNGIVTGYSYDAASELTAISYAQAGRVLGNLTYGYDLAGNQISRGGTLFQSVLPAAVTSGGYDAANRLDQWTVPGGGVSPSYDANGNLLNDGTRSFTWDARNRLTGIAGVASFSYDALGRRQSATINGNTVSYLYDGTDPVQEQAGGTVLANILTGLGIDERFMRTEGSSGSTYLTDALGSAVALTDGSGAIKTSYGYDPYGNTSALGTASDNRYQYAGRENDGTGLYFNRARYYNPAWGRFISEDPIGLNGGVNRYAYVDGNPIQFIDPYGLYHCVNGADCDIVPGLRSGLQCFDACSGGDSAITSGRRPPSPHHPNSSHSRGEACDLGRTANPNLTPDTVRQCFPQCFPNGYGQEEGNANGGSHYHFQLNHVPGGPPGFSSITHPYDP